MLRFAVVILCVGYVCSIQVDVGGYYGQPAAPVLKPKKQHEKGQDFSKIPGTPGVDYPIYHSVPHTKFSCHNVPAHPGMYANVETGCQAYHVCHDGREGHQGASFLCTNGTLFNQKEFACDWWYNVDCHEAVNYYRLNLDPEKNPYFPKKKAEEPAQHEAPAQHYAQVAPVQQQQHHYAARIQQQHIAAPVQQQHFVAAPIQQQQQHYVAPVQQQQQHFIAAAPQQQHYVVPQQQHFVVAQQQHYTAPQNNYIGQQSHY